MAPPSDPWHELGFDGAKAALLRRRFCAGIDLDREEFRARGCQLSDTDWEEAERWVAAASTTEVIERHASGDGTTRLVVRCADGSVVEAVVLPDRAACVSTQVGCAVGCRFCASGLGGLQRNLTVGEIVEQLAHARRVTDVERLVYMGMGEPSHNLDAVLEAVARVARDGKIIPTRQTLSTVGARRVFERIAAAEVRPCLALSLHTTDDAKRRDLLPRAWREDTVAELIAGAEEYAQATGIPIQWEWTLLAGVNDGDDEVERLVELLGGRTGYLNLIMWNEVPGMPFEAPSRERAFAMRRALRDRGVFTTIRYSSGADAAAACGQLAGRWRETASG